VRCARTSTAATRAPDKAASAATAPTSIRDDRDHRAMLYSIETRLAPIINGW